MTQSTEFRTARWANDVKSPPSTSKGNKCKCGSKYDLQLMTFTDKPVWWCWKCGDVYDYDTYSDNSGK